MLLLLLVLLLFLPALFHHSLVGAALLRFFLTPVLFSPLANPLTLAHAVLVRGSPLGRIVVPQLGVVSIPSLAVSLSLFPRLSVSIILPIVVGHETTP